MWGAKATRPFIIAGGSSLGPRLWPKYGGSSVGRSWFGLPSKLSKYDGQWASPVTGTPEQAHSTSALHWGYPRERAERLFKGPGRLFKVVQGGCSRLFKFVQGGCATSRKPYNLRGFRAPGRLFKFAQGGCSGLFKEAQGCSRVTFFVTFFVTFPRGENAQRGLGGAR